MSEFKPHCLGMLTEPESDNAREVEGVFNPAVARGSDRKHFGTMIIKALLEDQPKLNVPLGLFRWDARAAWIMSPQLLHSWFPMT